MKRRTFNKLLIQAGTAVYGTALGAGRSLAQSESPDPGDTLRAYFQTLIPAESDSPGAIELGIPELLYKQALQSSLQRRLYIHTRIWLDKEAMQHGSQQFSTLPPELQHSIVSNMENTQEPALEKYFFETTLRKTMRIYYSHPQVVKRMAYAHAPQPLGFPDFQLPPKSTQ